MKALTAAFVLVVSLASAVQAETAADVQRDSHGHIARSHKAKHEFEKQTGHPHGWQDHVIDPFS